MKKLAWLTAGVMFLFGLNGITVAGTVDSLGAPSEGSSMYTLSQIYDYLNSGTLAPTPSSFQEPDTGPGPSMKTLRDLYDDIKAKLDACKASPANVQLGVTFFSTQPGSWGVQTGSLVPTLTPTLTPTSTATPTATATPTWGPSRCQAAPYYGIWGATQVSSNMGCWIQGPTMAGNDTNCNAVCTSLGLTCDPGNWNDSSSCSMCQAFGGGGNGCNGVNYYSAAPFRYVQGGQDTCYYRTAGGSGSTKDCAGYRAGTGILKMLCVCRP